MTTKCRVCCSASHFKFAATILKKYNIHYFLCPKCGFLQTEKPYWLAEAYQSPINQSDTGYLARNISFSKKITVLLYTLFKAKGSYLDSSGGYGVFVRLMRDIGFDYYWEDKYTQNLFAQTFEYTPSSNINAITSFESFEHFENPIEEIERLFGISKTIIFSTELYPKNRPKPLEWWYYGLDHGQHISFYSKDTLNFIAQKFNVKYYKFKDMHIFSDKNISLIDGLKIKSSKRLFCSICNKMQSKTWSDYQYISNK